MSSHDGENDRSMKCPCLRVTTWWTFIDSQIESHDLIQNEITSQPFETEKLLQLGAAEVKEHFLFDECCCARRCCSKF